MGIKDEVILKKLNHYNGRTRNISHSKESDLALEDKYIFFRGFDTVDFSKGIDWNYKHKHTVATYQVYLHSLAIIRYLTNSYLVTKKEKYILKAREIIENWMESKKNHSFYPQNSSWKDHSAANRMKNIIYYQQNVPDNHKLDSDSFDKNLNKHCEFLSKKEFYSENNHGMMSDEALLLLSSYLKDDSLSEMYSQTAILRMERIILRLFSSSSYNLENSPEYHRLTQNLSSRFIRLVDLLELEFDTRCREIIRKSYERNKRIIKPNNEYPLIGDTGAFKAKVEKSYEDFIDYQAGIVFLNSKNEDQPLDSSFFTFKAGYLSRSHKHRDDLSLTYWHKGEDIFIDSGKYTYDRKNPKKPYIISPAAHTTISKINKTYELDNIVDDVDNLRINFVYKNDEYTHIGAINHLYKNIRIYRDILYFEHTGMLIVDRFLSDEIQFMGQNFNLAPNLKIEKVDSRQYKIITPKKKELILQEHTDRTLSKYFQHTYPDRGFYSEKFNELLETHQIEFRKNSFENQFVTSVIDSQETTIRDVHLQSNKVKFKLNDENFIIHLQSV